MIARNIARPARCQRTPENSLPVASASASSKAPRQALQARPRTFAAEPVRAVPFTHNHNEASLDSLVVLLRDVRRRRLAAMARAEPRRDLARNRPAGIVARGRAPAGLESAGSRRRVLLLLRRWRPAVHAGAEGQSGVRPGLRREHRQADLEDAEWPSVPRAARSRPARNAHHRRNASLCAGRRRHAGLPGNRHRTSASGA